MSEAVGQSPVAGRGVVNAGSDAAQFVVDGMTPRAIAEPGSEAEVAAVLREADARSEAVIVVGGGEHLGLGNVPARYDVALSTRGISGIAAHEPADLTVTCGAGTRLLDLERALSEHGQHLPLDPIGSGATVGGVVAANAYGPMRLAHGTARDWLIGIRVAHCDGSVSKAGGRVVKNVTGYEMTKLYAGSLGTLAVITEMTFKLAPLPVATQTVSMACADAAAGASLLLRVRDAGLTVRRGELMSPATSAAVTGARSWQALVDVAGGFAAVERSLRELRSYADVVEQKSEAWEAWRASIGRGSLALRFAAAPSRAAGLMSDAAEAAPGASMSATVAAGVVRLRHDGAEDDTLAQMVATARAIAAAHDATMIVESAPAAVKGDIDVFGEAPDGIEIMRRFKREFDPRGTLAPGRFVGRI
jgi:glycolate oxidase FAD binding subunit